MNLSDGAEWKGEMQVNLDKCVVLFSSYSKTHELASHCRPLLPLLSNVHKFHPEHKYVISISFVSQYIFQEIWWEMRKRSRISSITNLSRAYRYKQPTFFVVDFSDMLFNKAHNWCWISIFCDADVLFVKEYLNSRYSFIQRITMKQKRPFADEWL